MTSQSVGDEVLVLRQLAALRRANWPLGDALGFVLGDLGESALKTKLSNAQANLQAGEHAASADVLVATLSRGDANSADSLELVADARELAFEAAQATRRMRTVIGFLVTLALLQITALAFRLPAVLAPLFASFGQELPPATQLALGTLKALQVGAPVMLVVALAIITKTRFRRWSGERELTSAGLLWQWSSALKAGLSDAAAVRLIDARASSLQTSDTLALDLNERLYLTLASTRDGATQAADRLASHLLTRGRELAQRSRWVFALIGTVLTVLFVINVLGAMYLPIFSIAGAIK